MGKPEIRFKGYTDDWEQRKLGEISSLITKGTTPKDKSGKGEVNFIKVENIDDFSGEITGMSKISFEEHQGYLKRSQLQEGDILFSIAGTLGRVTSVSKEILPANTNQALSIIRLKEGNLEYVKTCLKGNVVADFIKRNPTIGAQPNLSLEQVSTLKIGMPSEAEQANIGECFSNLDHLITLHQRKCAETKKLKKYMLQKMFPQNGQKVPEIRFSGFTDDWEQRKLGDVTKEFKSGNALKADEIDTAGEYPVYGGNGLRGYTSTYNHDGEFALIGRQGALCGNTNYSVGKAYFTEHAVVVKADENNDTRFMYYMLDTMNLGQYSDQSAQPGLAVNKLVKLENLFPKKEEQQRVGLYFKSLDHLITLHQRKLEELQKVKKYMLQKMFV